MILPVIQGYISGIDADTVLTVYMDFILEYVPKPSIKSMVPTSSTHVSPAHLSEAENIIGNNQNMSHAPGEVQDMIAEGLERTRQARSDTGVGSRLLRGARDLAVDAAPHIAQVVFGNGGGLGKKAVEEVYS